MKRSPFLTGVFVALSLGVFAQETTSTDSTAVDSVKITPVTAIKLEATNQGKSGKLNFKKKLKYADKLFEAGNYFEAMEVYKELAEKKSDNMHVQYYLAECYRLARDYKSAEAAYKRVADAEANKWPLVYYYYGQMLKMNGKYEEAKASFNQFTTTQSGSEAKSELRHAKVEIDGCDFAINEKAKEFKITHLDAPLNKPKTDFAPYIANENTMYYSSINDDSVLNASLLKNGLTLSHIYVSNKVNGKWEAGKPVAKPLNSDMMHSGYSSLTKDGQRVYFTQCGGQGEHEISCKIYVSTLQNGVWSNPKALGDAVNKADSDNTQPSVGGTNGDTDTLYFSSNRANGKGGYDIYFALVKANGSATLATNLGEPINTEWDEVTPSYWSRRGILYFSSNGHVGYGGFDNYQVKKNDDGTMGEPKNLGAPANSSADDRDYTVGEDDKKLFYFVSNRPGIIGLKSETCCDDIFQAHNLFVPTIILNGALQEREDSSSIGPMNGARIEVYDVTSGVPKLVSADSVSGKSQYEVKLGPDKKYNVKFIKADHFPQYVDISTMDAEENDTVSKSVTLDKIIRNKNYVLGNIYYAYKSVELNDEAKTTLDTLAALLTDNPSIVIELSSHTDSVASDEYNIDLSQRRAQSCVDYLVKVKGIDAERLIAKGYGESQPIAPNSIGKKDNPEGRAKNRRTQYKVIGELKRKGDKIIFE